MFEAYKIGVKISLINNSSLGLMALSRDFMRTEADAAKLEARILSIQKLAIKGGLMLGLGAVGLSLFKQPLEEAKLFETQASKLRALGVGESIVSEAMQFSKGMNIMGSSARDNLKMLTEAHSILRDFGHAKEVTPLLAQMRFGIESVMDKGGHGGGHGEKAERMFMDLIKVAELRGALKDMDTFKRVLDFSTQAYVASGGLVKPADMLNMIKTGGVAAKQLSDQSFFFGLLHTMQEMGGSRTGTALMSAYQNWSMGRTTQQTAEELVKAGLVKPDSIKYGKTGHITKLSPDALIASDKAKSNPFAFLMEDVLPKLRAGGATTDQQVLTRISQLFSNRTASNLFTSLYLERSNIEKHMKAAPQAFGVAALYKEGSGNAQGKELDLLAKKRDLQLELGRTVLPLYVRGLELSLTALNGITNLMREHSTVTKGLTIAFLALSAGLAIKGTVLLLTAAFRGLGGGLAFQAIGSAAGITKLGMALTGASTGLGALARVAGVFMAAYIGWKAGGWLNDNVINPAVQKLTGDKNQTLGGWIYDATHKDSPFVAGSSGKPVQVTTQINMDGRKVAEAVSQHQAKAASKPFAGASSFDYGMAAPPVGMGYAR